MFPGNGNLKIAVQKKGRLTERSMALLKTCGLGIENYTDRLYISANNFPADILFLRDDDIPEYVQDGVADLGIVGENVIAEKSYNTELKEKLGFGSCRIMIAYPESSDFSDVTQLEGKRIATTYPNILGRYLDQNGVKAKVIEISGSVEIAPALGIADAICDIVSTGNTLKLNKLKKSFTVFESEAALIASPKLKDNNIKTALVADLLVRIRSVLSASSSKYLMMNVPKASLEAVIKMIPASKSPTILPLFDESTVAVHAVVPAGYIWSVLQPLRSAGASGILVLPIENMIP
ncbi:MAG: ATP phosphoribosyltransferase [Chlorobiota bacterium]|nr:MAG: ATP phosphoribosyltransferase [Chlorobiota bacterium]